MVKKCPSKCPVCRSSKITENDKGEIACGNPKCSYIWKPSYLIKKEEEKQ